MLVQSPGGQTFGRTSADNLQQEGGQGTNRTNEDHLQIHDNRSIGSASMNLARFQEKCGNLPGAEILRLVQRTEFGEHGESQALLKYIEVSPDTTSLPKKPIFVCRNSRQHWRSRTKN